MLNKLTHASTLRVEIEGFKKTARSQPNKNIQEKVLKLYEQFVFTSNFSSIGWNYFSRLRNGLIIYLH